LTPAKLSLAGNDLIEPDSSQASLILPGRIAARVRAVS
jgi:hypothetical protein